MTLGKDDSGSSRSPITVRAFPGETPEIVGDADSLFKVCALKWWTFDGLVFENLEFQLGNRNSRRAKHITVRNCEFRESYGREMEQVFRDQVQDIVTIGYYATVNGL